MTSPFQSAVNHVHYAYKGLKSSPYFVPGTVVAVTLVAGVVLRKRITGSVCKEKVDLTNKVVIITGASGGIGEETARALADMNAHVILACRDEAKTRAAIERIRKKTSLGKLDYLPLDLTSLESVRDFADEFMELGLPLNILILNAGTVGAPLTKTKEGFESHFGVNHLGHFLLTNLLLQKLISAKGRVVAVSSQLYQQGKILFDDLAFTKSKYDPMAAYCNSKLANVLFVNELQNRVKNTGVEAFSVAPGLVKTDAFRHYVGVRRLVLSALVFLMGKTPEQGAQTTIKAAISPSLAGKGGAYLQNCEVTPLAKFAQDPATAIRLWEVSEKMARLNREHLAREPSQKALR